MEGAEVSLPVVVAPAKVKVILARRAGLARVLSTVAKTALFAGTLFMAPLTSVELGNPYAAVWGLAMFVAVVAMAASYVVEFSEATSTGPVEVRGEELLAAEHAIPLASIATAYALQRSDGTPSVEIELRRGDRI